RSRFAPLAPVIALQFVPDALQRFHAYANVFGLFVQPPGLALSVCPSCATPQLAGGVEVTGGVSAAVTTSLAADVAGAEEPTALEAVTATRTVPPTSSSPRLRLAVLAPAIALQLVPAALQRFHLYASVVGLFVQPPGLALSVWPSCAT